MHLALWLLDALGRALEKAYQAVIVREVYELVRDIAVGLGLGHVIHRTHRRYQARRKRTTEE